MRLPRARCFCLALFVRAHLIAMPVDSALVFLPLCLRRADVTITAPPSPFALHRFSRLMFRLIFTMSPPRF